MQTDNNFQSMPIFVRFPALMAVVLATLLVGCSDKAAENAEKYDSYVDSARTYSTQGQYRAAMIEGTNAIQLVPERLEAYQIMARIYLELGQSREAVKMLNQITAPDEATRLILFEANLDTGKLRSAEEIQAQLNEPNSTKALSLRARLAATRGDSEKAKALYQQAVAQAPADLEILLDFARLKLGQGQVDEAIADLKQVAADTALRAESLYLQAAAAAEQRKMEDAESLLNEAIAALPATDIITPLRFTILSALKDNLTAQGKVDEAMIYEGLLQEALPGAGQSTLLLEEAYAAIQEGDLETARSSINEAVEVSPRSSRATTLLATVDFLEGNSESAVALLDEIIDPETSSATELQIYAVSQLRLGNAETVIERLGKDVDNMTDSKLISLYGVALQLTGKDQEAKEYFKKAVENEPDNGRLHIPLAQQYANGGQAEEALTELRRAFEKSPNDVTVQRLFIGQLLGTGATEEADDLVKGLEASYPESQETQFIVGNYYLRQQKIEQAEKVLNKVLSLGEAPAARQQLANIMMSRQDYSGAEAQFRKLIEVAPNSRDAYRGLVTSLELNGKRDAVVPELEKILSKNASNIGVLTLSEYYGRNGRLKEAVAAFDRFQGELSPEARRLSESLTLAKSRELLSADDVVGARALINEALTEQPESERLLVSLIDLNIRDGKFADAKAEIDRLASFSEAPAIGVMKGDLAAAQENFETAISEYLAVFSKTPNDQVGFKVLAAMQSGGKPASEIVSFLDDWVEAGSSIAALMARAGYYLETDDTEKAKQDYLAVLETDPNNVAAHNNLAWTYGEASAAEALAASKKAYDLASNNAQIMDTYGWFLHVNGKTAEALPILEKALELAPNDEEIQGHYREASGG